MMDKNDERQHVTASNRPFPRKRRIAKIGMTLLLATGGIGGALWACADASCEPGWQLAASDYNCEGRAAISPGNDTRINLLLLMRSLNPVAADPAHVAADPDDPQFGRTFMSWPGMRAAFWPEPVPAAPANETPPVCAPAADASPAFNAALAAERDVPAAERAALIALRMQAGCGAMTGDINGISSKSGRDYLAYLQAADSFHKGDYPAARRGFAALTRARSRWVAETAIYMPIRIGLRAAIAPAVDEYGDFAGPEKTDAAALAEARSAIVAYLKAYPKGRYAKSAQGLMRRVAWLSGDMAALTHSYEKLLAATPGGDEAAADLAEEIDIKLLEREDAGAIIGRQSDTPLLLAVADLKRMRKLGAEAAALSKSELTAQQARFAAYPDLYGLLQASRAYYAGDNPRTILTLLPDAARQKRYTPIGFSRQMMRGMALGQVGDPQEAAFWRDLLAGASPLYERPLVEMGLAIRWQRDGRLEQVFAPGSPVTDSRTREILLQTMATPLLLRGAANDAARPAHERDVARFTLLYKDLTRGAFRDFADDLALVPASANSEAGLWNFAQQDIIPVGLFRKGQWSDDFACPAIAQTAATLARSPTDHKARLCLGDFYRLNGFDGFSLFTPGKDKFALGNGPDGFAGRTLTRADIYAAIIADKRALPENRAYALYRAVMCYAPSGYSACVGSHSDFADTEAAQAPKATRKAWFTELKQRYPHSQWASALRYYW